MPTDTKTILGLDVGERRIGVALAGGVAKLANPLTTIENNSQAISKIVELINDHDADALVVGLPRGLDGQNTRQTAYTFEFVDNLKKATGVKIHEQDEALTSRQAEAELKSRGKPYVKADIDSLAATYIL